MIRSPLVPLALAVACSLLAMPSQASDRPVAAASTPAAANPFDQAWGGTFGAVPFDRIEIEHFPPALDRAMAEQRTAIAAITANPAPADFANTLEALERSSRVLGRVTSVFGAYTSSMSNDRLRAIQRDYSSKLAWHRNEILLDPALYARVKAVHDSPEPARLGAEQARLASRIHTMFVRAGAALSEAERGEVATLSQREAELQTAFAQNLLQDTDAYLLLLDEKDLAGLPQAVRDGAAQTAASKGHAGKYGFTLQRPSVEDFLTFSERRDLREQLFTAFINRGDNGNAFDNNAIITELVALRAQRAQRLGFDSHAHYITADSMAKTPKAAIALTEQVWAPALVQAKAERAVLEQRIKQSGASHTLAGWDWRFYAEQVRREKFNLDPAELQPYLSLDNILAASFDVSKRLFGLTFSERKDIPAYHPDVRVFEVTDQGGQHVGLYYGDFYAREGKGSGAWMSSLRPQHRLDGAVTAHVVNNLNVAKPPPGKPALISVIEAETHFHELGHALHGLLSQVTYPSLSGTSVPRDYVEFPAQFMEHYVTQPAVLRQFAKHAQTGEAMPDALIERFIAASKYNQGFATTEFLASALVDQRYHALSPEQARDIDPDAFERQAMAELGALEQIPMRHRSPHFAHIFAGGYSAAYYAYLWSEVLDADGFAAFQETGDIFDAATAARLKQHVYSRGDSRDWAEGYRAFRGADPSVDALLRNRGFPARK